MREGGLWWWWERVWSGEQRRVGGVGRVGMEVNKNRVEKELREERVRERGEGEGEEERRGGGGGGGGGGGDGRGRTRVSRVWRSFWIDSKGVFSSFLGLPNKLNMIWLFGVQRDRFDV